MQNNLKKIRFEKGLTQQDMADMACISRPAYNSIELGKVEPQIKTMQKLSKALDMPIGDIFLL